MASEEQKNAFIENKLDQAFQAMMDTKYDDNWTIGQLFERFFATPKSKDFPDVSFPIDTTYDMIDHTNEVKATFHRSFRKWIDMSIEYKDHPENFTDDIPKSFKVAIRNLSNHIPSIAFSSQSYQSERDTLFDGTLLMVGDKVATTEQRKELYKQLHQIEEERGYDATIKITQDFHIMQDMSDRLAADIENIFAQIPGTGLGRSRAD